MTTLHCNFVIQDSLNVPNVTILLKLEVPEHVGFHFSGPQQLYQLQIRIFKCAWSLQYYCKDTIYISFELCLFTILKRPDRQSVEGIVSIFETYISNYCSQSGSDQCRLLNDL